MSSLQPLAASITPKPSRIARLAAVTAVPGIFSKSDRARCPAMSALSATGFSPDIISFFIFRPVPDLQCKRLHRELTSILLVYKLDPEQHPIAANPMQEMQQSQRAIGRKVLWRLAVPTIVFMLLSSLDR